MPSPNHPTDHPTHHHYHVRTSTLPGPNHERRAGFESSRWSGPAQAWELWDQEGANRETGDLSPYSRRVERWRCESSPRGLGRPPRRPE